MNILVLGSQGQLGLCLKDQLDSKIHNIIYASREQIDLSNSDVTKNQILKIRPNVIINASAYTSVDLAEEQQEKANIVNYVAVANIAKICSEIDCFLVHVSTDYVFDGDSSFPYRENDGTNPQSIYGHTKLRGEIAIKFSRCKHLIIRTAWVFSEYGNNFLNTMLRLGAANHELGIVGDQIGCPTYAQDIARVVVQLITIFDSQRKSLGLFHYCGNEACSWHDFAAVIFEKAEINGFKTPAILKSIETSEYPTVAVRPKYSVLDCRKIESSFGITPSDWRAGIEDSLAKLKLNNNQNHR